MSFLFKRLHIHHWVIIFVFLLVILIIGVGVPLWSQHVESKAQTVPPICITQVKLLIPEPATLVTFFWDIDQWIDGTIEIRARSFFNIALFGYRFSSIEDCTFGVGTTAIE